MHPILKLLSYSAFVLLSTASAAAEPERRPNILFILTDDQGYGDMACHGNPIIKTPEIDKLHAICVRCGQLATRNQRLIDGHPAPAEGPTIQVGGLESYEARCRSCHEVPALNRAQIPLPVSISSGASRMTVDGV